MPISGTIRPLSGNSASLSTWDTTSPSNLSPTSGTCRSMYQALISSRSLTAETVKVIKLFCGIASAQSKTLLHVCKIHFPTLFQVHQPLHDVPEKCPLIRFSFVILKGLDNGNASPPAG